MQSTLGSEHPETKTYAVNLMAVIHDMASIAQFRGDFSMAEKLYRGSLGLIRLASGNDEGSSAIAMVELARLIKAQGRLDDATKVFQEAIVHAEAALGPDHALTREFQDELLTIMPTPENAERAAKIPLAVKAPIAAPDTIAAVENYTGLWHGRSVGSAVNTPTIYDRWLENGILKGTTTVVPFYVAGEELTIDSDGTVKTAYPTLLGYTEREYRTTLPNETDRAKVVRGT